jgi:hypothetical protein
MVNAQLYHYAGNNPVKYTDPDGRTPKLAELRNAFNFDFGGDYMNLAYQNFQEGEYGWAGVMFLNALSEAGYDFLAIAGAAKVVGSITRTIVSATTPTATAVATSATVVTAGTATVASRSLGPDPISTLTHIFANVIHNHKMSDFLASFGGDKLKAGNAIADAAQSLVTESGLTGIFPSWSPLTVKIGDTIIKVAGRVMEDGLFRVTTAFIE